MEEQLRTCTKCRTPKPLFNFYRRGDGAGYRSWCAACTTEKHYQRNPPKTGIKKASRLQNRHLPPEQQQRVPRKLLNLKSALSKYGLSVEAFNEIAQRQGGVCAICHKPPAGTGKTSARLNVDHDHKTGRVRSLLCSSCNQGLGLFHEDEMALRAAADYIEKWKAV